MPLEQEAKIQVPDHDEVRRRLAELGAPSRGRVLETNIFFDTPERKLLAADEGLRIRRERPLDGEEAERCRVTFKGPRQPGAALKTREELEAGIDESATMEEIFGRLGFVRVLMFEKRRETFLVEDCEVALDELPHLGTFIEIEGESESAVMAVREMLGLGNKPLLTASYVSMLASYLQEHEGGLQDVRFE